MQNTKTKHCYICANQVEIDWKNAELLQKFMDPTNQIKPRKYTNCCAKHQRRVAKAIKRARVMGVVPFTTLVEK